MSQDIDLHAIPALHEVYFQSDLKLRPLHISDAERLLEILAADPSIRDKVTVASRFHTPEDIAIEIELSTTDPGLIRYTLLRGANPIGIVSLWRDAGYFGTTPQPDDYGFGYFLDPAERGKGLVVSAVQSLMAVIAENLLVNSFIAFSVDQNVESIAVLTKLGFQPTDQTFVEPKNSWVERKYVLQLK